jgi:glutaredoxin
MKSFIRLMTVAWLYLYSHASWPVDIIECEDEQGNKSFAQQCPPGSKAVNRRSYSTFSSAPGDSGPGVSATLYVVPACDTCDQVREFLAIRKIPTSEKNIAENVDLQTELKEKTGGDLRVPVVIIGDKVLSGYNRASLQEALAAAGYKEPEAAPAE